MQQNQHQKSVCTPKKDALYLLEHKRRRLLGVATKEKHHNGDQIPSTTMQNSSKEVAKKRLIPGQIYFKQDNAKPHVGKVVKEKLTELGWEMLPHPPYSPDLALSDYHLFRSLSNDLRGKNFQNESDLKRYLQDF